MEKPNILNGRILKASNLSSPILLFFRKIDLQSSLLILLALLIAGIWLYLGQAQEEGAYPIYLVAVFWMLSLVFLLWLGNLLIYRLIRYKLPWESAFKKRFFLQFILSLLYSLVCINGTYLITKNIFTELPPNQNQLILLNIYGILFLIPVLSVQFGVLFLQKWKKAVVEQERLKKEQVQSELTALKSHLSPHFMFNSLNILSSLIQPDNNTAQEFLDCFAEVYRYVLKNRDIELISLREELAFIEAYRFLLHSRFSNSLDIQVDVPLRFQDNFVPPLALQMLVENAIKHNELSETEPLQIRIFATDTSGLVIQNNLRIRTVAAQDKVGFGLENIRRRYWLIARQDISVETTHNLFSVTIPLVKIETA